MLCVLIHAIRNYFQSCCNQECFQTFDDIGIEQCIWGTNGRMVQLTWMNLYKEKLRRMNVRCQRVYTSESQTLISK